MPAAQRRHKRTGSDFPFALPRRAARRRTPAPSPTVRLLGNGDPIDRRRRLDPRRRVHDVAGTIPSPAPSARPATRHLARIDPDPHLQAQVGAASFNSQSHPGCETRPDRPLRIILVSTGAPNTAITASPMNFSTVPPNRSISTRSRRVIGTQASPHILRIHALGRGREPDQIAKQHRHHLTLFTHRSGWQLGQRRRAERTKRKLARKLLTTGGARRHPPSLRPERHAS